MTSTWTSTAISEAPTPAPSRREVALALSTTLTAFRSSLRARGYVEVITPHLTPFATEDTGRAFPVRYLDNTAYLGQSRRRYHQMALPGLPNIFEVGPVFWAHNVSDGTALTQYTTVEFAHARLHADGDPAGDLDQLLSLLAAVATAVAARLPEHTRDPSTDGQLRWIACARTEYTGGPFPISRGTPYAVLCGDRVVAVMTFHRGDTAELEADLAGVADEPLGEPFVEGFAYGTPDHASCVVVVEPLLACLFGASDLRNMALFPRDAAITSP